MQPAFYAADMSQPVLFMPAVFNETLGLLFDTHHYFEQCGEEEQLRLPDNYRSAYTGEMSRITMRLTSIMAWIMVRKAIHTGKLGEDEAAQKYRLDAADICLTPIPKDVINLPFYIGELAERSRSLYERVHRLDEQAYGSQA